MNATEINKILHSRYSYPEWIFMNEVSNDTGSKLKRFADCIAVNAFPSMGYAIHGIEIKVARGDLLKEMDDPSKSNEFFQYCDRWFIACPKGMIKKEEIPAPWGIIFVNEKGESRIYKQALQNEEKKPVSIGLFVSMLRRVRDTIENEYKEKFNLDEVNKSIAQSLRDGFERGKKSVTTGDISARALSDLRKSVSEFQEKSGICIQTYNGKQLAEYLELGRELIYREKNVIGIYDRIKDLEKDFSLIAESITRLKQNEQR